MKFVDDDDDDKHFIRFCTFSHNIYYKSTKKSFSKYFAAIEVYYNGVLPLNASVRQQLASNIYI